MTVRWWLLTAFAVGCVPKEGACVWTGGTCYDTSRESCAEDDEAEGGSTFHDGDTCDGLGCTPNSNRKNEAWYTCEASTGS